MSLILGLVLILELLLVPAGSSAAPSGHLVLGGEDGDGTLLLVPTQVEEGPDGNLYVLDTGDAAIKVFTPTGEFLRGLGRQGEGPGEFQRTDGATFGFTPDGRLFFTESYGGHRWLTLLHLDGTLERTVSPQLDTIYGLAGAVALPDGRYLLDLGLDSRVQAQGEVYYYTVPQVLTVMDRDGALGPELVRTEHVMCVSTSPDGGTTTLPFLPPFCWLLDGEGNVVWTEGLSPRLSRYDLQGRRLPDLPTALPEPVPVTEQDLDHWKRNRRAMMQEQYPDWWARFGRAAEAYDKPLYPMPVLTRLTATPAGGLLAEGRAPSGGDGVPYWLLDPEGNLARTVTLPVFRLQLSAHHLLFFTSDDEGLTLVHAVVRPPDEAHALDRLADLLAPDTPGRR